MKISQGRRERWRSSNWPLSLRKLCLFSLGIADGLAARALIGMQENKFNPRPDDILVAGYPGSGLSLLQLILYQLTTSGEMDFPHLGSVAPLLEAEVLGGRMPGLEDLPSPRIVRTHLLYRHVPRVGRTIYLLRDVHQVARINYRKHRRDTGSPLSYSEFIPFFVRSKPYVGSWFDHTASWWPHRRDPGVLFLTHDDLVADLAGTARRIAAFCGAGVDEERMQRVSERCNREFMARHAEKFDPLLYQGVRQRQAFLRKGRAGSWRGELPPWGRAVLEERVRLLARELGEPEDALPQAMAWESFASRGKGEEPAALPGRRQRSRSLLRRVLSLRSRLHYFRQALKSGFGQDRHFTPRESDIFIVTFPRSGTTLSQMLLYQLSRGDLDFPHINDFIPWFEMDLAQGRHAHLEALPEPRIFKSHLPYDQLPRGRYIFVVRDVRDVAISSFHHFRSGEVDSDLDEFLAGFLRGEVLNLSWFDHVRSCWPHRNDPNVLLLSYEKMIGDLDGTLRTVATFCGFEIAPDRLPELASRCSFHFMKQYAKKFEPRLAWAENVPEDEKGSSNRGPNFLLERKLEGLATRLGSPKTQIWISRALDNPNADE